MNEFTITEFVIAERKGRMEFQSQLEKEAPELLDTLSEYKDTMPVPAVRIARDVEIEYVF